MPKEVKLIAKRPIKVGSEWVDVGAEFVIDEGEAKRLLEMDPPAVEEVGSMRKKEKAESVYGTLADKNKVMGDRR